MVEEYKKLPKQGKIGKIVKVNDRYYKRVNPFGKSKNLKWQLTKKPR